LNQLRTSTIMAVGGAARVRDSALPATEPNGADIYNSVVCTGFSGLALVQTKYKNRHPWLHGEGIKLNKKAHYLLNSRLSTADAVLNGRA
jgi:hypothetical protein